MDQQEDVALLPPLDEPGGTVSEVCGPGAGVLSTVRWSVSSIPATGSQGTQVDFFFLKSVAEGKVDLVISETECFSELLGETVGCF